MLIAIYAYSYMLIAIYAYSYMLIAIYAYSYSDHRNLETLFNVLCLSAPFVVSIYTGTG